MASWGTRGVPTPSVPYLEGRAPSRLRATPYGGLGLGDEVDASRVVARVLSASMEQLAQFVSKSFDNASLTGAEHACRNLDRPPSARITLSVAHLLGDPAENDSGTFSFGTD